MITLKTKADYVAALSRMPSGISDYQHDCLAAHAYQMALEEFRKPPDSPWSAPCAVLWINDRAAAIHAKLLAGETM